ncbi:MAG TPA: glycerate kinase, partial [Planctomycetaceae bacterium]|nr:glycerate kinase [Planctomycetaceae bacterium]
GPTDAAGAFLDEEIAERITGLSPDSFLAINDSHTWCDQVGALIRTGPTHTNVMDIAVGVVDGR